MVWVRDADDDNTGQLSARQVNGGVSSEVLLNVYLNNGTSCLTKCFTFLHFVSMI